MPTYDELFQEFKLKIEFLPGEPYKHLRKEICEKIGVTSENLNHYLKPGKRKKVSLSRDKLVDMLEKLNKNYGAAFLRKEFLPDALKPYALDELSLKVEETSGYDSLALEVKALKEMFFDYQSRAEEKDIEQLHEQFQRKKEDIAGRSDN